jgi:hypothetical protein
MPPTCCMSMVCPRADFRIGATGSAGKIGGLILVDEREGLRATADAARTERDADTTKRHAEAANRANDIWSCAEAAAEHPYLTRKEVAAHGIRGSRGDLVLPLRDAAGRLRSLQFIKSDGSKKYLFGGQVTGCYFAIGEPGDAILIGEGFATCASAHEATGRPVAIAFDCGNLRPVAEALRAKYPAARIVILADDDYATIGNPGITKARDAAAAVGGLVAVPEFGPDRPDGMKDFNDMSKLAGAAAVKAAIESATMHHEAATERVGDVKDLSPPGAREFPVMAQEAFVGLPGDIVRVITPHTESDPVGLLLSAHAFFGNCIGRGPHYKVEATEHGTNLFVVKCGDTSKARKGTGEDRVLSFFRHVDDDWASRRIHTGLSSGEGVIWEVRDPITKLVTDKKSGITTEEIVDHGVADKRLMVIESEFAGALRVMQREGNILSRILRDGWDRGNLATLTKNSPARATGACISITGISHRRSYGPISIGLRWRTVSVIASYSPASGARNSSPLAVLCLKATLQRSPIRSGAPSPLPEASGKSQWHPMPLRLGPSSIRISLPIDPACSVR